MASADDRLLVRRALDGDQSAFDALYRTHRSQVHGVISRWTSDRDAVEDLVQITFMRAFRALGSFRGESAFPTWLTQIALNVSKSHLRSRQVRERWLRNLPDAEALRAAHREPRTSEDPERALHQKQRRELVRRGIESLPDRYRRAMWLHYVMDWSYEEITHALQVPIGTVKTWLCRARRQLEGEFRRLGLQPM